MVAPFTHTLVLALFLHLFRDWMQVNLGLALGERESGTARLKEAITAYRPALEEVTRARVPLEWATSTGNQGVVLRLIAERRDDLVMAERALNAAFYEAQLPATRALLERLRKG